MPLPELRAQRIEESIRRVLVEDWDPMGVRADRRRRREYDRHIPGIYALLVSGAPVEAVAQRLAQIEQDDMGLTAAGEPRTRAAAEKLCTLDLSLGEGSGARGPLR